ncbi:MAG: DUF4400 domain-containing protein [Acidovorax sp.]
MIRIVAVASLTALLLLVLYLPSAHPPERFMHQVREEHQRATVVWGHDTSDRILDRMLSMQAQTLSVSPVPTATSAPPAKQFNRAVGREMAQVNQRLFNSPYFRSIDALLALATYRLAALLEWLPKCAILALALFADAFMERAIKSHEFRHHDPEMFALYASVAIFLVCASVVALVWPWTPHPAIWACVPVGLALLLSRALAHFHRRP